MFSYSIIYIYQYIYIYIYILYSNQIYRRKKWAIYTRNNELTERIKKKVLIQYIIGGYVEGTLLIINIILYIYNTIYDI